MQESDGDARYWLPPQENGKPLVLTAARKRRGDVVGVVTERGGREFRSLTEPLEFYVAKRVITGKQYRAGKRLHSLWEKNSKSPYVQVQYRLDDGGAKAQSFAPVGFGAVEYREALFSVRNDNARLVVFLVCCEGITASKCLPSVSRRSAERKGMHYLREALDQLADHFKYE